MEKDNDKDTGFTDCCADEPKKRGYPKGKKRQKPVKAGTAKLKEDLYGSDYKVGGLPPVLRDDTVNFTPDGRDSIMAPQAEEVADKKSTLFTTKIKNVTEEDYEQVSRLYLEGKTARRITDIINQKHANRGDGQKVSIRNVQDAIKLLRIEWKRNSLHNIEHFQQLELEKLNNIEARLWDAYNSTKEPEITVSFGGKNGTPLESISLEDLEGLMTDFRTSCKKGLKQAAEVAIKFAKGGDPRFLALILQTSQSRRKLLGLDAPERVNVTSVNVNAGAYDLSAIPTETLVGIAGTLEDERQRKLEKDAIAEGLLPGDMGDIQDAEEVKNDDDGKAR